MRVLVNCKIELVNSKRDDKVEDCNMSDTNFEPVEQKKEHKNSSAAFTAGWLITVAVTILFALFIWQNQKGIGFFWEANLNEIGDLFAGFAGTLAFVWIIVTVLLQRKELEAQRKELELTRSVVTKQARAAERQTEILDREAISREHDIARRRLELLINTAVSVVASGGEILQFTDGRQSKPVANARLQSQTLSKDTSLDINLRCQDISRHFRISAEAVAQHIQKQYRFIENSRPRYLVDDSVINQLEEQLSWIESNENDYTRLLLAASDIESLVESMRNLYDIIGPAPGS